MRAMRSVIAGLLLVAMPAGAVPEAEAPPVRFVAVHVYIDAKTVPLAAYQFDFTCAAQTARIVGLEGSPHPAFAEPPHYDPKAMTGHRVIAAAFSIHDAPDLPTGQVRIATVHLQVDAGPAPRFDVRLVTAGDWQGRRINAEISYEIGVTP